MDDYISKPVDLAALEDALDRWSRETRSQGGSEVTPVPGNGSVPEDARHRADGEAVEQGEPAIDGGRLTQLRQLEMPDGSSLLPTVVDTFLKSSADQLGAIRRILVDGDADLLRQAAHGLRGASANVGAHRVAALSRDLESAARLQNLGRAEAIVSRLEDELRRAHAALQGYVGAPR